MWELFPWQLTTRTVLLYFSLSIWSKVGAKAQIKMRFDFLYFLSFLLKNSAITFRIREKLCFWQRKCDQGLDVELSLAAFPTPSSSLLDLPLALPSSFRLEEPSLPSQDLPSSWLCRPAGSCLAVPTHSLPFPY